MKTVRDKVIAVTGAGSGIGRALALELCRRGARLSLADVDAPGLQETVRLLEIDAPERPVYLFVSPWQLLGDGLDEPRPGWRIEGSFLFLGRITGGLPGPGRRARRHFG